MFKKGDVYIARIPEYNIVEVVEINTTAKNFHGTAVQILQQGNGLNRSKGVSWNLTASEIGSYFYLTKLEGSIEDYPEYLI